LCSQETEKNKHNQGEGTKDAGFISSFNYVMSVVLTAGIKTSWDAFQLSRELLFRKWSKIIYL
jgi:hypothetical protein